MSEGTRDIKFRVFDGEMHYAENYYDLCQMFGSLHQEHSPLMQYTGLKDWHGVEVYEGDILTGMRHKPIGSRAKVVFDSRLLTFVAINDLGEVYYIAHEGEDIEILGNIYSDPELLESDHA